VDDNDDRGNTVFIIHDAEVGECDDIDVDD